MELNAEMNMVMTERFNVSGAMLVKLFGRPRDERESSRAGPARFVTLVSTRRCTNVLLYRAVLDRVIGDGVRLRLRWRRGDSGELALGTLVALTLYLVRLYGPLTQLSI